MALQNSRISKVSLFCIVKFPAAPHTEVAEKGGIVYSEVVHENVRKLEAYVEEMASGDTIYGPTNARRFEMTS